MIFKTYEKGYKMKKIALSLCTLATLLLAEDASIDMPSSAPIEVFQMSESQRGVGIMTFSAELEVVDSYYEDKIGDIDYLANGVIYTIPKKGIDTIIGNMFELSFTAGTIDSKIKDHTFTYNGSSYNNDYQKDGFYIGIRPSFNKTLHQGDKFDIKSSTTFHAMLYRISGDFSVNNLTSGMSYAYDEDNYGIALKPTTVIQSTFYPTKNIGISLFGGVSAFAVLDYCLYSNKNGFDEDSEELAFQTGDITTLIGYDVSFKFGEGMLNLSSAFTQKSDDSSSETMLRYVFSF